jgi:nucleoside-diphosphate-sugar epimerase
MAPHRPTLLIVGCGDVGRRVLRLVGNRFRVLALTSTPAHGPTLRALGAVPLQGNLDRPETLYRLSTLADRVLHLAPPPVQGRTDPRTAALLRALARGGRVQRLVYASTTGVYGDAGGARFDETRRIAPANDRAWRRADAEARVRRFGRVHGVAVTILRIPGIYTAEQPLERLRRGTPVLVEADDVHTNHVHADDLARICVAALLRGRPQRVVHASDHSDLKMGDYFDLAARIAGLPSPPRITRDEARTTLSPLQMSFLSESRRLDNTRLVRELGVRLRHPTVAEGLSSGT